MTPLKTAAALLALAAPTALYAAHGPDVFQEPGDAAPAAQEAAEASDPLLAMSIGKPVTLTQGEQQTLRTLVPGLDPALVPPAKVGKLRAILYGQGNDAEKRGRIERLLN